MGKKKGSRKAPTNPKPHGPNLSPLDETPLDKGLVEKEELAILSSFPMKDEREAREAIRLEETAILSQSRQHQTKSSGMLDWLLSSVPPILSASAVLGDDFDAMIDYHLAGGVINRNIDGVNLERPSEEWTQKCAVKSCKRLIRPDSSQFHCSVCAQTFCSSHAGHPSLQIQQDGLWVRACKACWQEKTGLDDAEHMIDRNWTPAFETQRLIRVNQRTKETSMLVGRLEKVSRLCCRLN